MQLLRGDLATGALRADTASDMRQWCRCDESKKSCRVFTEAGLPSLTWVNDALMVSHELAPCPAAPHFRVQYFHIYASWNLEPNTAAKWALLRGTACAHPNSLV